MQISDLLGHYNSTATQAKPVTANKGVEQLTSSIEGLSKGNIFEGTVSSVKGGKVTLALSNGQTISARLEGKILLQQGQSMFFQVKSNNGIQVEIRPYTAEGVGNPTLLQALKAANLPIEEQYISMVNKMMEENMPIDKNSLSSMAKLIQNNVDINVDTLVQLEKLGLPINKEIAYQFENYLGDKQAIVNYMDEFMEQLSDVISDDNLSFEQLKSAGQDIINIVTDELPKQPEGSALISTLEVIDDNMYVNTYDGQIADSEVKLENLNNLENPENIESTEISDAASNTETIRQESVAENSPVEYSLSKEADEKVPNTLGSILTNEQMEDFSVLIKEFLPAAHIKEETSIVSVLDELSRELTENPEITKTNILKLFSSEPFKAMINDTLKQKWMIDPKDVASYDKIEKIYEQVRNQIDKIEHTLKENGINNAGINNIANNIKGNVEFMNQINQAYTYVQLPLKMSGQNASGELYVYTNKKSLKDENEELSAFLHLDMEHLGSTDVSVKLHKKDVTTNFYFENENTYDLIEKFLPQLEERLKKKGYNSKIFITNEERHVNFVEDFLKKDQPSAGKLHRYSFDMRA